MTAKRVAVVIPVRDEARLLPRVLSAMPPWVHDVVIVDDGSRDRTWDVIEQWRDARAYRVRFRHSRGVGAAILAGYASALQLGAGIVVVVGGDAQMDLAELSRVVAPVADGRAAYVQGNRFDRGNPRGPMPEARRIGNRILSRLTTWACGRPVGDSQCGFTAAAAEFVRALRTDRLPPRYGFPAFVRIEAHALGARVLEVPVRAIYGDEVSGIHPLRDPAGIGTRILLRGLERRAQAVRVAVRTAGRAASGGLRRARVIARGTLAGRSGRARLDGAG